MSDFVKMETHGMAEILRVLERLPAEVSQKNGGPVKRVLAKVARKLAKAVSAAAPVRTGALRDNITARRGKPGRGEPNGEIYLVGPRPVKRRYTNNAQNRRKGRAGQKYEAEGRFYYARFLEDGTKYVKASHFIERTSKSMGPELIAMGQNELIAEVQRTIEKLNREEGL